jgi:hypothetical protein
MKFLDSLKTIQPFEIFLIIVFILFLILPFDLPFFITSFVDSPLGIIAVFIITVTLFIYTNPILGILFIFVAYELMRRSALFSGHTSNLQYTPTQRVKDSEMRAMNPPQQKSLEEEVIEVRAPIGKSNEIEFVDSDFKPVTDKILYGATVI